MAPAVEDFIAAKARTGASCRAISAMLLAEMGVKLGFKSVSTEMKRRRTEKSEIAKVIVREVLGKSIPEDLARLERLALKAEKLADGCEDDPALWAKLADQVRKFTETKLHFSGADTPDDSLSSLADAESRLSGRLDRLAEGNGEGSGT